MKEELEKILLKAGVPKGIHRVKLDTEIVADRYSPENINKISTTDTFTEALTSIINLFDKAERKAYRKGQLNPACQICKKPLKFTAHYHKECWSKSITELSDKGVDNEL